MNAITRTTIDDILSQPLAYIPPVIPDDQEWLAKLGPILQHSVMGVIDDVWLALVTSNQDKHDLQQSQKNGGKAKPLFLLWDEEIPKPNPLTSLFWLLTCEVWPMQSALDSMQLSGNINNDDGCKRFEPRIWKDDDGAISELFPPQTLVPPQSCNKDSFSGHPTAEFALSAPAADIRELSIDELMKHWPTRHDRECLNIYNDLTIKTRVYRPQVQGYVHLWAHLKRLDKTWNAVKWPRRWTDLDGWPHSAHGLLDGGFGYTNRQGYEMADLPYVYQLRKRVFDSGHILSRPGLATLSQNLYDQHGGFIHNWSTHGIAVQVSNDDRHKWTPRDEAINIRDVPFPRIPAITPRIWFGWTHFGYKYNIDDKGSPTRVNSAAQDWVEAYLKHRPQALQLLMNPEFANLDQLLNTECHRRAGRLEKLGRIVRTDQEHLKATTADAFNNVLAKTTFKF